MSKVCQNLIIIALAFLLPSGSVAHTSAGILSCIPKTCCCATAEFQVMDHRKHMEMPQNCTPQKPAPCCQIEPSNSNTVLAITSSLNDVPQKITLAHILSNFTGVLPHESKVSLKANYDDGRTKIPLVPIYLQTQSFLF